MEKTLIVLFVVVSLVPVCVADDTNVTGSSIYAFGCGLGESRDVVYDSNIAGVSFRILSPYSSPLGVEYQEWGNRWWTWVFNSAGVNATNQLPIAFTEAGDIDCDPHFYAPPNPNNSSNVLFLAGYDPRVFSEPLARTCSKPIPEGTSIFVPIANTGYFDTLNVTLLSLEELNLTCFRYIYDARGGGKMLRRYLSAWVDDVPIQHLESMYYEGGQTWRFKSNSDNSNIPLAEGLVAGTDYHGMTFGYYLWIDGLKPGNHTIRLLANTGTEEWCGSTWAIDVLHHFTIAPSTTGPQP